MNYLIPLILLFFSSTAFTQQTISFTQVCQNEICYSFENGKDLTKNTFSFNKSLSVTYNSDIFSRPNCSKTEDCYLFLGFIADSYAVTLNGVTLTNLTNKSNYTAHNSIVIPIPNYFLQIENNVISIEVKDLNNYQWGMLNKNIMLTNYRDARILEIKDWLLRTGFTIFSAYFLLIFSLLTIFTFFILQNKNTLVIFGYCLVSFFYLISFSEFPREFADPEFFSGIIHFPLRLIQDVSLFYVFHQVLNRDKRFVTFYKSIFFLYILVIGTYFLYALIGKYDFNSSKKIILIAAPLVAIPMCYGFLLATSLKKGIERSILVPLFFILFLFQINDLLLFWQLTHSFFTVKFYIPFIIVLVAFIEIRQYALDYTTKTVLAEKVQNAKQIAHDIRSPLSALNILSERISFQAEEKAVFVGVIQAIDGIASSLVQQTNLFANVKSNITDVVHKVIAQKKVEYPELIITFENDIAQEELCIGDPIELSRVVSNVINNAWEAMSEKPVILVNMNYFKNFIQIKITDTGIGMPKHVVKKLGTFGFTYGKETHAATAGSGLGVYNAIKTIEKLGGEFSVVSAVNQGTTVDIKIPKA